MSLPPDPDIRGFLPDEEGDFLYQLALEAAPIGPLLEIGSYCGRSTLWLAEAAKQHNTVVFALDHHRGSEEHQPGELFHDSGLVDDSGQVDTLGEFRRNMARAGVEDHVIPIITRSATLGRFWQSEPGMVFIDGGHSLEAALTDWRLFGSRVAPGGILAIHDVYDNPVEGGQAPFTVWRCALDSGLFAEHSRHDSLRALRRLGE